MQRESETKARHDKERQVGEGPSGSTVYHRQSDSVDSRCGESPEADQGQGRQEGPQNYEEEAGGHAEQAVRGHPRKTGEDAATENCGSRDYWDSRKRHYWETDQGGSVGWERFWVAQPT